MSAPTRWMLLLDTCGAEGSVGVADLEGEPRMLAERSLPGRGTQEWLMPALAEVLQTASLTGADLDVVAVVTGPGSFTGVRIGLAAAKGLAQALALPVVALSRLEVLAAQAGGGSDVQAWIDAGRSDIFVGLVRGGELVSQAMLTRVEALAGVEAGEPVVVMEASLVGLLPSMCLVPETSVRQALPLAAAQVRSGSFADVALLDANYLRIPDAELARQRAGTAAR